jgi:2-polyprenyl-3-methyl-5-hydroxy-6-metoxy-1,4-benzoquinol methylase
MAELGAQVVATDFSSVFIERARKYPVENPERIEYQVVDATDRQQLLALGEQRFDAAVSSMALMDMAEITPLFESLVRLLKPAGRFVFSLMHPCFNSVYTSLVLEQEDREGEIFDHYAVKIAGYIQPHARRGAGIVGEPEPHYYFHRPLSLLLNTAFQAGFVLDRVEEPVFDDDSLGQSRRTLSWLNFHEIPPAFVARLRHV